MNLENINPNYYKNKLAQSSLIDVLNQVEIDFSLGNAIKYIFRAGRKSNNTKEDYLKAIWYLHNFIKTQSMFAITNSVVEHRKVNLADIYVFVENAEISITQKEWLKDLFAFTYHKNKTDHIESLNKINKVITSINDFVNHMEFYYE